MGEFEAARFEVLAERAIGGRGEEEHHGRGHDVVPEPGLGDLFRAQAAADAVVAFEDEDLPALLAQQGGGDQRIDAAADDDIVMGGHGASSPGYEKAGGEGPRRPVSGLLGDERQRADR